jgi:hypothetical protein
MGHLSGDLPLVSSLIQESFGRCADGLTRDL